MNRPLEILARTVVAVSAFVATPVFAQTQPTRPSALATYPTMRSGWVTAPQSPCRTYGLNPTSPCYSGTVYPDYSAVPTLELPNGNSTRAAPRAADINEAKAQIEAKGYRNVSKLERDRRGIWRGEAAMQDGTPVDVTLDLEGNIYSQLSRLQIRIEPPRSNTGQKK